MKTIQDMAKEVRLDIYGCGWPHDKFIERIEAFAKLVREDERELITDLVAFYGGPVDLEAAIRARSNT